ncbi:hypothetical protein CR513_38183, partial [Mucuna pruriens]
MCHEWQRALATTQPFCDGSFIAAVNFEDTCKGFLEVAKLWLRFCHDPMLREIVVKCGHNYSRGDSKNLDIAAEIVEAVIQTVSVIFEDPGVQELLVKLYQKVKLFDNWRIKMLAIFCFQDAIEVQKLDSKAWFLIYQCVNSKEAWEILVKTYGDWGKNKKNSRIGQCSESLQGEGCKEKVTDQQVVDKILKILPPEFDYVAVAIEESKDLNTMEVEELQHSLEANEMRINKRRST